MEQNFQKILKTVKTKSSLKQSIYRNTVEVFETFREEGKELIGQLQAKMQEFDKDVSIEFVDKGKFEFQLKIGGDVVLFYMHSNVFDFEKSHPMFKTSYLKEDINRSYCGTIFIYNFLADSFKYDRFEDSGFLLARIFVNKDNHFFAEGRKQLGFLHNDFANQQLDKKVAEQIVEHSILYSMGFDLFAPPIKHVQEISVGQMIQESSSVSIKTSKRVGYKFSFDEE